jgi:LysM repeat protein
VSQPPAYPPPPRPLEEEASGPAGPLGSVLGLAGNALAWARANIVIAVAAIVVLVLIVGAAIFLLRGQGVGGGVGEATPIPLAVESQPEVTSELPTPDLAATQLALTEAAPIPEPTKEPTPEPTEEPTPEPTEEPVSEPSACPSTHTVQPGENLFRIGLRYGIPYQQLATANGIANPSSIQAGQVLSIPYCGSTGGEQVHIVQTGENLFRVALRYGVTWEQLAAHNNLSDPRLIHPGDALRIPD